MSEKAERQFWQLHLSTLSSACLVCSMLFFVNISPKTSLDAPGVREYGFPFGAIEVHEFPKYDMTGRRIYWLPSVGFWLETSTGSIEIKTGRLIVDVLLCLLFILAIIIPSESLIRRREGRKS